MVEYDVQRVLDLIVVYIVTILILIIFRKKVLQTYVLPRVLVPTGLLFLYIAVISNSLGEGDWSLGFIRNFLLMKKIGIAGFRKLALSAYLVILVGVTSYLLIIIKKLVRHRDEEKRE